METQYQRLKRLIASVPSDKLSGSKRSAQIGLRFVFDNLQKSIARLPEDEGARISAALNQELTEVGLNFSAYVQERLKSHLVAAGMTSEASALDANWTANLHKAYAVHSG